METTLTTLPSRGRLRRPILLGTGTLLAALLLLFMAIWPPGNAQATSTTWTATLTSAEDDNNDQWGYEEGDFGTLSPTSFLYDGDTYVIEDLKWDESGEYIEFVTDRCLDSDDFTSLAIDSTSYSLSDDDFIKEDDCESYPSDLQRFRFYDVDSNPLEERTSAYRITVTIAGGSSGTNPSSSTSSSPCLTQLEPSPGTPLVTSGKWVSSCDSENRSGRYAKFYSFTLEHQHEVDIVLDAPTSRDPYMYLLEGEGTSGSVIEKDDDGAGYPDSRITRVLSPSTYTIEATTNRSGRTGSFKLTVTVKAPTAERVATTTVNFGRSLTQPKGLAWDGSQLFMVDDGTDALYTVATSTGVATRISSTTTRFGLSARSISPRGLAWDGSTLYMTTTSKLYKLNTETGVATLVGSYGTDISGVTGLAWKRSLTATSTGEAGKPAPGRLYMVDGGEDALYIVDTATGSATPVDAFAVDSTVSEFGDTVRIPRGISWVGSNLYMVSSLPGNTYLLDETTGTVTDLGPLGIKRPTDLAWDGSRLFVLDEDTDALHTISGVGPRQPTTLPAYGSQQIGSAVRFGLTDVTLDAPYGITMVGKDLYMAEDNTDFLYKVDRKTGVAEKVGSDGLLSGSAIQPRDLAWDGTTMYMATPDALYTVNTSTGVATRKGPFGVGIEDVTGIAWDGERENLYMVDRDTDALYKVATSTGDATRVNRHATITNPSSLTWITSGDFGSYFFGDDELSSLYTGDAYGNLYHVNDRTGYSTYQIPLGNAVTGLAWFIETSTLYYVDDTSDALHTIIGFPGFLPNAGDLYYNGSNFADGFVRWDSPAWVQSVDCLSDAKKCSTYEHDLKLDWKDEGGWFDVDRPIDSNRPAIPTVDSSNFCTAWSDFPTSYDDCPTAGVWDSGDSVELSFGTFKAPLIKAGRDYYGFWIFKNQRGAGSSTDVKLHGQEGRFINSSRGRNSRCSITVDTDNIWCVIGRQEGSILESGTTWSYGTPSYTAYSRP